MLAAHHGGQYIPASDEEVAVGAVAKKQRAKRRVHRAADIVLSSDDDDSIASEAVKIKEKRKVRWDEVLQAN